MKNKQLGWAMVLSWLVFMVAMVIGGETGDSFGQFIYYASLIAVYVFNIWGMVRLIKTHDQHHL